MTASSAPIAPGAAVSAEVSGARAVSAPVTPALVTPAPAAAVPTACAAGIHARSVPNPGTLNPGAPALSLTLGTAALTVTGLHKAFGPTRIIQGVELSIAKGERHAVIGPNGAGKSTLFHLISGRLRADAGQVLLDGADITGLAPHDIFNRGLARSFQVTSLFPKLSVFENLRAAAMRAGGCGLSFWRRLDGYAPLRQRAEELLHGLGLERRRDTLAGNLAYAEQRALEIGVTVAGGAHTILLDEPTAGMSRAETERAVTLIRRVTEGRTLVMIEHDLGVVFGLADRISVLAEGRVIASGPPDEVRGNAAVRTAYLGAAAETLS